jgi:hypothetical protein
MKIQIKTQLNYSPSLPPTPSNSSCSMHAMNPKDEFIKVEKRIRALSAILSNMKYHITPSSGSDTGIPTFLRHFATLLTTGDMYSPDAKVAVTGFLCPNGKTSTLVVTRNPFSQSEVENLCIKDVSKSRKSFDEIVDLNR